MRRSLYLLIAVLALVVLGIFFARSRKATKVNSETASSQPVSKPAFAKSEPDSPSRANTFVFPTSLNEWRRRLKTMPEGEAANSIREFLRSGKDSATQQPFAIGRDGYLTSAPTLRTFLLDELGKRDKAAAAQVAEQILKESSSPDEWALALKYYALGGSSPDKNNFLSDKMQSLLHNTAWQQNPSVGYLESFDVAVWLGGTNLIPALCDVTRKKDNQAIAHAGYLSLDRLVQNDPVSTLSLLQADPSLMEGREQTRANYFARADVGDPAQRKILEQYLLNPSLSGTELQTFAGLYPNANYMVSYNLLTSVKTPDGATLSQKDARALQVLNEWMADERFARLRPRLDAMRARLKQFVKASN